MNEETAAVTAASAPSVAPTDIVSASEAARAVGMTAEGIRYWIQTGRVRELGRGKQRARLVSLSEVREAAAQRAETLTQQQAARILHMEFKKVAELCESGHLPYRRVGRTFEIAASAVERIAREKANEEQLFVSVDEATKISGWPRDVILSTLAIRTGWDRRRKLVSRAELDAAIDMYRADPPRCETCDKPTLPGRRFHKGRCVGSAAADWLRTDAVEHRRAARERQRAEFAEHKREQGLLDIRDVARLVDRDYRSVWRHAELLGSGTRYSGAWSGLSPLLFDEGDVDRLRRAVQENPQAAVHHDPRRRGDWYLAKFGSTKMYGRANRELRKRGKNKVGRPSDVAEDEALVAQITSLRAEGYSQQKIANVLTARGVVPVSRDQVKRVLDRHKKLGETPQF